MMITEKYKAIRERGHFTIIDDNSVQRELSRMLLKNSVLHRKDAEVGK